MVNIVKKLENKLYQLTDNLEVFSERLDKELFYKSKWFIIVDQKITILKGFTWNGCTKSRDGVRNEFGIPFSWIASCVHDALYSVKFKRLARKTKDLIFLDELKKVDFKFLFLPRKLSCYLYYIGVRSFGVFSHGI